MEKAPGTVTIKYTQPLPQDVFIEEFNQSKVNIYNLALLSISNSENVVLQHHPFYQTLIISLVFNSAMAGGE